MSLRVRFLLATVLLAAILSGCSIFCEVLALVGESGSGKSVTSTAIMGLLDETASVSGSVRLHGTEILGRSDSYMSRLRGSQIAMVFQDPLSALTPVYTVGQQMTCL